MATRLNKRQTTVLIAARTIRDKGHVPTVADLVVATDLDEQAVRFALDALLAAGRVRRPSGASR